MNPYWRNLIILLVVSLGVDYWIATLLASNESEVWFFFILLLLIPLFYTLKSTVVRTATYFLFMRQQMIDEIFNTLVSQKWPRPTDYQVSGLAEDYVSDIVDDDELTQEQRMRAAITHGYVTCMDTSQLVLAKFFWSSSFKAALKKYDNFLKTT